MKDETLLNLVIVEQDTPTVSRVEAVCREAGFAVSALQVTNADELRDALRRQRWDLIVAGTRVSNINVSQVIAAVTEQGSDAPVVAVTPPGDEACIADILDSGVRDAAVLDPADRLKLIVRRETADLRERRSLVHYKRVLEEYERQLLYFLGRAERRQVEAPSAGQRPLPTDAADPDTGTVGKTMVADQTSQVVDATGVATPPGAPETDTPSPPSFLETLSGALADVSNRSAHQAVLYIMLNKNPVAALGTEASQVFLTEVEKRLRDAAPPPCLMSVYEDFVFVALIGRGDRQDLVRAAYAIKEGIEGSNLQAGGRELRAACSIGACPVDQSTHRTSDLIANAKAACEKAAVEGGKRVYFAGPVTRSASATDEWAARLRAALKENRFRLVFQPVVHFHAAPTETYEILLRMIDEKGREIMPGEFIPKAEECGLMQEIDRLVVNTAASALQQRRESEFGTRLFVKLSAASIESRDFPAWLEEMLQTMRLRAESLVFQLSEPMVSEHLNRAREFTQWLTTRGCGAALDQFGLQKDSLQTLKTLPVTYLKIHGKLIQSLARDTSSQNLLKDIVDAARATGKVTIAGFVQDPYILSILWRCQVDYVQGFYFQPPNPTMAYDFTSTIS